MYHRLWLRFHLRQTKADDTIRRPSHNPPSPTPPVLGPAHIAFLATIFPAIERALEFYKNHDHGLPHVAPLPPARDSAEHGTTRHALEPPPPVAAQVFIADAALSAIAIAIAIATAVSACTRVARLSAKLARLLAHGAQWLAARPTRMRSSSELRATRAEERGDGVCPSALGNSASFPPRPIALHPPDLQRLRAAQRIFADESHSVLGESADPDGTIPEVASLLQQGWSELAPHEQRTYLRRVAPPSSSPMPPPRHLIHS